jgi:putative SOS response-associated peptidase YedK
MCGRFTLTRRDRRELAAELGVADESLADYRPRYNIAPMQNHFVMTLERENRKIVPARWGLVNSWAKDNQRASKCINAKAETVEKLPTFRAAFKKRRCAVPADGFYEWRGPKGMREPLWIHPRAGGLILFAGLYEAWQPEPGQWEMTFTIITTAANKLIQPIHDRMPVILSDRAADDWMNPNETDPPSLKRLLVPAPDDLLAITPASPLVNSVKNDGPELLTSCRAPAAGARA